MKDNFSNLVDKIDDLLAMTLDHDPSSIPEEYEELQRKFIIEYIKTHNFDLTSIDIKQITKQEAEEKFDQMSLKDRMSALNIYLQALRDVGKLKE